MNISTTLKTTATGLAVLALALCSIGCASTPTSDESTSADQLASPGAVADDHIVLIAHGMACPKCVTNADLQLMKLPGVASVRIDMQHGILDMTMTGEQRPTQAEIAKAIDDAGLTLVSVQGRIAEGSGS